LHLQYGRISISLIVAYEERILMDGKQVILVADDEPVVRDLLQRVLTGAGYEVMLAESGEQAIELSRTVRLDMILMDINMPGIGGVSALRTIAQQVPMTRMIMLTAVNDPKTAKVAMDLGAIDYLTKPIDIATLKKVIHTHLLFAA